MINIDRNKFLTDNGNDFDMLFDDIDYLLDKISDPCVFSKLDIPLYNSTDRINRNKFLTDNGNDFDMLFDDIDYLLGFIRDTDHLTIDSPLKNS